jgi:hypothetical protein
VVRLASCGGALLSVMALPMAPTRIRLGPNMCETLLICNAQPVGAKGTLGAACWHHPRLTRRAPLGFEDRKQAFSATHNKGTSSGTASTKIVTSSPVLKGSNITASCADCDPEHSTSWLDVSPAPPDSTASAPIFAPPLSWGCWEEGSSNVGGWWWDGGWMLGGCWVANRGSVSWGLLGG